MCLFPPYKYPRRLSGVARHSQQRREHRRTETRGGIPSANGVEAGTADSRATSVASRGDIRQRRRRIGVQPRVQETQASFAVGNAVAVDQLDDTGKRRGGTAGTVDQLRRAIHDNDEVSRLRRHIGVRTTRRVEVLGDGGVCGVVSKPRVDRGGLVARLAEQIGEATAAVSPGLLRRLAGGAAHGRHPGARGGEAGGELLGAGRVDAVARAADAAVTRCHEDGHATGAELGEEIARAGGVVVGHGGLVIAVRDGQRVGQVVVVEGQEVVEELDVGLVGVGAAADPLAETARAIVGERDGLDDGARVLDVEVGLVAGLGGRSGALAVIDLDAGEGLVRVAFDGVLGEEGLQVGRNGVLLAVRGES